MKFGFPAKLAHMIGLRAAVPLLSRGKLQNGLMGLSMSAVAVVFALTYILIFMACSVLFIQEILGQLMARWQGPEVTSMPLLTSWLFLSRP